MNEVHHTTKRFLFEDLQQKKLEVDFDGGEVSSDAGVLVDAFIDSYRSRQVLKIGARVRQLRTRIKVHLPTSYPWQSEWAKLWASCRGSP